MKNTYFIEGMDCADCALKVEKGVSRLEGVDKVELNFTTTQLVVEGSVAEETITRRVEALGYRLRGAPVGADIDPHGHVRTSGDPAGANAAPAKPQERFVLGLLRYLVGDRETRQALVGGGLILLSFGLGWAGLTGWFIGGLQIAALALAGYPIARSAVANLWINRDFNMNFLMITAAIGAVIIGEIPEAASLIFLFAVAEALEGYSVDRARRSIQSLAELAPPTALRMTGGRQEIVPVAALQVGDRILVRAGDRIPMDGQVSSGSSEVNQAPITGESLPVAKTPGDEVFAGTVNGAGALEITVTLRAEENTLARIIRLVEQAQAVKAPSQRFIDRFARYYTPAMLGLALLAAVLPPILFGQPFLNLADGTRGWLYRGLAMLVIGCPCALVISTPVTIVSSIAAAARRGVLIKGGAYLEALQAVRLVAFDKTGTLTRGEPVVSDVRSVDCVTSGTSSEPERCQACDDVLALAYAVEQRSGHPLAQAVVSAAEGRGLADRFPSAENVTTLTGMGLQGRVNGGLVTVGNHRLFEREHPHAGEVCDWIDAAEEHGRTTMLVCDGERVRGYLAVSDVLRQESAQTVAALQKMGVQTVMLTGDNPKAAQAVAQDLGIEQVFSGLMPADKVDTVRRLESENGGVAMVGDGINDTPALAAASVGVAMGGAASAQAMETADIVLMADGLARLPFAFRLSRLAHRLILQNVVFSLATKLIFIILALAGWTTLWLAVLADMGVSLLVTFNGMRPLGMKADEKM